MEEQPMQLSQKDGSDAGETKIEESSEGSGNEDGQGDEEECEEVAPDLAGETEIEESSEGSGNEDGQGDEEEREEVAPEPAAQKMAVKRNPIKKPLTFFKKIAISVTAKNLPFVLGIGTVLLDVLINLASNDISHEVQGSSHVVVRFIPYLIWFTLTMLWAAAKRGIRRVSNLRKYEAFMVFVGCVLCDILINFACNVISSKVQRQTFIGEIFLPYALLFTATIIWYIIKRRLDIQQVPMPQGIFQGFAQISWESGVLNLPN